MNPRILLSMDDYTKKKKKEFSVCLITILIRIVRISFPGKGVLPNV